MRRVWVARWSSRLGATLCATGLERAASPRRKAENRDFGLRGGSLSVPYMLYCNVPMIRAVGTSAALAWPIAVAGAVGYLYSGWHAPGLPEGALGFWYLPAVAVLSVATVVFAPLGVKAAHKLPPEKLKLAFGILLMVIAAKMMWNVSV